jgi:hypothetical protein
MISLNPTPPGSTFTIVENVEYTLDGATVTPTYITSTTDAANNKIKWEVESSDWTNAGREYTVKITYTITGEDAPATPPEQTFKISVPGKCDQSTFSTTHTLSDVYALKSETGP